MSLAFSPPTNVEARSLYEDVPIPGGTTALSRALGLDPAPDRARFMTELVRVVYDTPEGANTASDALLLKLSRHLEAIDRFQAALAPIQRAGSGITLAMASQKNDRDRLKEFLGLIGLKLREKNKRFSVERNDSKQAAERVKLIVDFGVDLAQLSARLNRGESVRVDVPTETVPLALPAKLWSEAVFQRPVAIGGLFSAVVSDRRAALLSHGLAALDDETLEFLAGHPAVVTRLYEHDAGVFAAFAGGLHVRQNASLVPGGSAALSMWESVVDEKANRPDRFIRELFNRDDGRVAYLYESLAYMEPGTAAFVLGAWIKDAGIRADRFKALLAAIAAFPGWNLPDRPFQRPSEDPIVMLTRVAAERSGAPVRPMWRTFWSRAFDSIDIPNAPARSLKNVEEDGPIDAAWIVEAILGAELRFRNERVDQLAFGQRVFSAASENELGDVLVAVRAFPRYRMLMLTLDRMGVRHPTVYAAAARHAKRLSELDATRAYLAFGQFQGALAQVARLVRSHAIDGATAEALVTSLSAVPLDDERYAGAILRWLQRSLLPAIGATTDDVDAALVSALAGSRSGAASASTRVTWEGQTFRVDLATPEAHRLTRVLQKLRAEPLSRAVAVESIAEHLTAPSVTVSDVQGASAALKTFLTTLTPEQKGKTTNGPLLPAGVDPPPNRREVVSRAIQQLSKISKPKDAKKAVEIAAPLFDLVDDLTTEALLALAYALDLGDPESTTVAAGNVSRRHDFGFRHPAGPLRERAAWKEPAQSVEAGVPWHVTGSLLALDVGLSPFALRRISTDSLPEAPSLGMLDKEAFSKTVALLNAFDLRDDDPDAIASAIALGRQRVTGLPPGGDGVDVIADEIRMDGWRRSAVRWLLAHDRERVLTLFSLTDLLYLGKPEPVALDTWGMAAVADDGCLCTRLPVAGRWHIEIGRVRGGVMATHVADLNLRVAVALHDLKLPGRLAKGVLSAAMQDYIDRVKPLRADDWITFVRVAQALTTDQIEDYVAGLTADGPLVAESASAIEPIR